jgi:hypothetical protein
VLREISSEADLPGTALAALKYAWRRDSGAASLLSAGIANSAAAAAATIPNRPRIYATVLPVRMVFKRL